MRFLRAIALAVALLAFSLAPASAIPDGGAGPNTAGASASASPRSLAAGATIHFTISGFPAGEVVYIKIDDGNFCSDKGVHGACVVHQQRLSGSGSASGSFVLPSDLSAGAHWLRFLASEEMTDASGNYLGVKGYTTRKGADFTVVQGSSGSSSQDTTSGGTSSGGATGSASAGTTEAAESSVEVLAAGKVLVVQPSQAASGAEESEASAEESQAAESTAPTDEASTEPSPAETVTLSASASAAETSGDAQSVTSAASSESSGFPAIGTVGLVLLVSVAGGLVLRARRSRA